MHSTQELLLQINSERDVSSMKLSELRELTGVKHLQQIKHHRNMLMAKGLLLPPGVDGKTSSRTNILGKKSALINIPILGAVNAGVASIYAEGRVEDYLRISIQKLPIPHKKTLYALRAVGDSMNEARIGPNKLSVENGDYVIADGDHYTPEAGDYVVSLINGMANIKRIQIDKEQRQIVLLSESSKEHPPIILDIEDQIDYLAQSKVLHVIKMAPYKNTA